MASSYWTIGPWVEAEEGEIESGVVDVAQGRWILLWETSQIEADREDSWVEVKEGEGG